MTGRALLGRALPGRLLVVWAVLLLVLTGCGRQIEGTAVPAGAYPDPGSTSGGIPDDVLRECELVEPEQIAAAIGSDSLRHSFYGAICRWDADGPTGVVRVTFNWFENGSLDVERETNERLGYTVTDVTLGGRGALQLAQPDNPSSCGAAGVAPSRGVIGWWVHYRPGTSADACAAASKLLELSFNRSI